jgi:DME family drug/metabolite transporter
MARIQVLLASLCFGTTGTAQALGPDGSPLTVGAARVAAGAIVLILAERLTRHPGAGPWSRWTTLIGGLGVAGYQLCFFAAVKDTGVAVGTVVALGSAPALAGIGAMLLDGSRPGPGWGAATALASAGVALMALAGADATVSLPGIALALGAGASYAVYTLTTKRLLSAGHAVEPVMARQFAIGAVLLIPVLVWGDIGWLSGADGIAMVLFLGLVPTGIAYLLFARGLRALPAGEVATLTLAEPVTAALLGAVVLGERPGLLAVGGIALILGGLAMLALPRRARPLAVPA